MAKTWLFAALLAFAFVGGCLNQEVSSEKGFLEGKVTIGPICPVERPDVPCPVPPEAYEARKVLVYAADKTNLVAEVHIDNSTGMYQTQLSPGVYVVDVTHSGVGGARSLPAQVTVESNKTVILDIDVDTGIR
ncbi:Uncharacterised protein [uncultured archaeon]|nr:Uncharacterised protein [uncultured archaeon]